ncbi:T9SS type A sorting domain-containing protein [Dyadobacter psychrophilus]|nr:T9SS type A sorting domain-containing protein [Dyadobacter psychrophilus]
MREFLLSVSFCFLFLAKICAQTPSIEINTQMMPGRACVDAPYQLPVVISGRFDLGNQFKVQVRSAQTGQVIAELPATLAGDVLELKFTDARLYDNPNVYLRILTSSPKTETPWLQSTLVVYSKGNVALSQAAFSDSVNLYDDYRVRISGSSTSYGWATLNDSSRIQLLTYGKFDFFKDVMIVQDGPLRIVHAENECGAMQISGSVKPVVNKTSIKTLAVNPQLACEGAELIIGFSVSGSALPAQTKYKIRFSDVNSNDAKPKSVDVPAQLKDGFLVARFPENFNVQYAQEFVAQVVTDNAVASQSNRFVVRTKPSASFNSASQTIRIGDFTGININLTGLPPFTLTLSDGTTLTSPNQGPAQVNLGPDKTTAYTIKSLTTGCGNAASIGNSVLEINVNPGIRFADVNKKQSFCAGSKASVKYVSNAELTPATQFWIELTDVYNDANKIRIPATRSGDQLFFDAPNRLSGFYGTTSKIITANPSMESPPSGWIDIQTMPTLLPVDYNIYNYATPSSVNFSYIARGGGPYVVEMPEGEKINLEGDGTHSYIFYLKENREFRVKSISNGCFKNENLTARSYRITGSGTEPAIALEPLKGPVCSGDSLEVNFEKFGNFNAGNQFEIQLITDCCDYKTIATVSNQGKYKVKVSANSFNNGAVIRVASTSPIMFSETRTFGIQLLPENNRLAIEATKENPYESMPYYPFETLYLPADKGVASRVEFTENGENKVYLNTSDQGTSIPIKLVAGKVNEYVIKSVSNVCGTVPLDLKTYIYAVPYRITIEPTGNEGRYCMGGPISIPFGVADAMSKPATFSLQIAKDDGSFAYTTIASTETARILTGKIPAAIEAGYYRLRVLSSDGVVSPSQNILIGTAPTAQLGSGADSEPLVLNPGENTNIKVSLTGGAFWWVVYEDNSRYAYSNAEEIRSLNPMKGGKFFVKSIYNFCGYGTALGSVTAKVNPGLQASNNAMNVCEGSTAPVTYALVGDADISDDYIRFELVNLATNQATVLDSTKTLSGTRLVKMPETFPDNRFEIRVVVRKYSLSATLNLGFLRKPSAILSGNTTINSGEETYIMAQITTESAMSAQVTLSDGTKSDIYGGRGDLSYIRVSPKQTTTYTIASIRNSCSTGVGSGSAIVEVNPVSARSVSVTNVFTPQGGGICAGSEISVLYELKGTFTTGNKFTVQISDSTGRNFTDIQTSGSTSPLKATVPLSTPDGRLYRVRVVASDAGTSSSAFKDVYTVAKKSKARFSTESVVFDGSNPPHVQVLLEGGAPWTFRYGTEFMAQTIQTNKPSYDLELFNAAPGQIYRIIAVNNACGSGDIGIPGTVRVEVITGPTEPASTQNVRIFPNPTQDILILEFSQSVPRSIELFNISGRSMKKLQAKNLEERLDISKLPSGIYVIEVMQGDKKTAYRILKE